MRRIITENDRHTTRQDDIFIANNCHTPIKAAFARRFCAACRARFGHKPNQTMLARQFGVSQGAVSEWSNGLKMPGLEKLIEICLVLNVCVEWLGTGRGPKIPPCVPEPKQELTPEQKAALRKIADILCQ